MGLGFRVYSSSKLLFTRHWMKFTVSIAFKFELRLVNAHRIQCFPKGLVKKFLNFD
jgi:hypothetical protein